MENKKSSKFYSQDLNLYYGENHALKNVSLDIEERQITALIGPSGCGKSTFLKTLNRMNDLVPNVKITGKVVLDGEDIYAKGVDVTLLRKKVGMVFQSPNPFPMSIYDNIAYGPRLHGVKRRMQLDEIVEKSLRGAAIWDEVKDRLKKNALGLSGGQQQRLCIARALAVEPEVLLMDEPTKGLDAYLKQSLAEMLRKLADQKLSILMVTHDLEFAASYADRCGLLFDGQLISEDEPHGFFSGNRFYTTAAGLIAGDRIEKVITCGEVIAACQNAE